MSKKRLFYQGIKRQILSIIILTIFLFMGVAPGETDAAGLLIADGGFGGVLEIKEHDVHVTINNGIAVTNVTQVFHNTENRQVEALYTFPVPKGASVANFSMWINGKEMVGEVLEKKRAREIYNSYKRRRKDPGLLEQVDYKNFEMRIYPINANADQKVQITYYQEIGIDRFLAGDFAGACTDKGHRQRVGNRIGQPDDFPAPVALNQVKVARNKSIGLAHFKL